MFKFRLTAFGASLERYVRYGIWTCITCKKYSNVVGTNTTAHVMLGFEENPYVSK